MIRGLQVLLWVVLLALTSTPSWAHCRPETRVGGFPVFSFHFAPADAAQPIESQQANTGCGYDFASEMHKYLYCKGSPINGVDPSGNDMVEQIAVMTIRTTLFTMNVCGAVNNARQTEKFLVSTCEAIDAGDTWNASMSALGTAISGSLTAMNLFGAKAAISSLPPPPAGFAAVINGGGVAAMWRFAASSPASKKWIFEEALPAIGGTLGFFALRDTDSHEAYWEHRDENGDVLEKGEEESGSFNDNPGNLSYSEQLETHTEWKILAQLRNVKPGHEVTIDGEYPPCNPGKNGTGCHKLMQDFAVKHNTTMIYKMKNGPTWTFPE